MSNRSRLRRSAALAGLSLSLAACAADRSVTGSTYPRDYRERHPIVLADTPRTLDIFVAGPALDPRQRADVLAFAEDYRRTARGPLAIQVPAGVAGTGPTLDAVRRALAEQGLPSGAASVSTYRPSDPTIASPIRLSFAALKAKVASTCGLWPQDLGVSDPGFNMRNEPYWNLGCATQANMAAQVADPVDLVRGRQEGLADATRRAKDVENIRQGKDPSTQFRQDGRNRINQAVGN
ncbi:MAG TPA: CpaD family pilus assembly protein [Salinarimonas sp.]|jgi:pilus assembly protein CpaD|nr:CpaD family pilus assembly protein [Salinarimonas sp.]